MTNCYIRLEVEEGKVKEILDRLQKAQEEIYSCYNELESIGVIKVTAKEKGGNMPAQG